MISAPVSVRGAVIRAAMLLYLLLPPNTANNYTDYETTSPVQVSSVVTSDGRTTVSSGTTRVYTTSGHTLESNINITLYNESSSSASTTSSRSSVATSGPTTTLPHGTGSDIPVSISSQTPITSINRTTSTTATTATTSTTATEAPLKVSRTVSANSTAWVSKSTIRIGDFTTPRNDNMKTYIAAGSVVGAFVVVLLVILVVICLQRRRPKRRPRDLYEVPQGRANNNRARPRHSRQQLVESCHDAAVVERVRDTVTGSRPTTLPAPRYGEYDSVIKVENLRDVMAARAKDKYAFSEEYMSISMDNRGEVCDDKKNAEKNRFRNVLPYVHSRVKLQPPESGTNNDYINASFVKSYKGQFILAQGPLKHTLSAFWTMIWQQPITSIVMLTNPVEDGKEKCVDYLRHDKSSFGSLTIEVGKEELYTDYTRKELVLKKGTDQKSVPHFHMSWPDHGVPETPTSVLTLWRRVTKLARPNTFSVVHCSAGIGRSGTFVAIDYVLRQTRSEGAVNVRAALDKMRNDRPHLIDQLTQYQFVYRCLLEDVLVGDTCIPLPELDVRLRGLRTAHRGSGQSVLATEYEYLEANNPPADGPEYRIGLHRDNRRKNKNPAILPRSFHRVELLGAYKGRNDYINAVFVDGYHCLGEYIVTQLPGDESLVDFWRMVLDYNLHTVIVVESQAYVTKNCPKFLVSEMRLECFNISALNSETHNSVVGAGLKVSVVRDRNSVAKDNVKHDHVVEILMLKEFLSPAAVVELNQLTTGRSQQGPIIVMCRDGAQNSGLYVASSVLLETMRVEKEVDVFRTVRTLRNFRPQFITSTQQYSTLYDQSSEFHKRFETYANFK